MTVDKAVLLLRHVRPHKRTTVVRTNGNPVGEERVDIVLDLPTDWRLGPGEIARVHGGLTHKRPGE